MTDRCLNEKQKEISETLNGIIVVDAGPGTGKTYTITNRFINIILSGVDPSEIFLLTFTKNAAEEMRDRVVNELYMRNIEDVDLNSVRASTFDAFCNSILLRDTSRIHEYLGLEERLSRHVGMMESEAMERRDFREFYTRFMESYGENYGTVAQLLWDRPDDVRDIISRLLTLGTCPVPGGWFRHGMDLLYGDAAGMMEKAKAMNHDGRVSLAKKMRSEKELLPNFYDLLEGPLIDENLIKEAIDGDRDELFRFLHHVFTEYLRHAISENRLTFAMVAFFAFLSLYKDPRIREEESYRYLMIDEFQDTNELQFLIALLVLNEPNLCVVGDWKQGIYGFRYADIENLLEFDQRIRILVDSLGERVRFQVTDIKHLSLVDNYRSSDKVIRLSERTLCLPASNDGMDPQKKEYIRSKLIRLRSVKEIPDEMSIIRYLKAEDQAAEVDAVLWAAQHMVQSGLTVREQIDDGKYEDRPLSYGDVAVLSRRRNLLHMIERRARELRIPLRMDGDLDIFRSREGKTALAWLRLLMNPHDERGRVAVMDLEGYSHEEILRFSEKNAPLPQAISDHLSYLNDIQKDTNRLLTSIFARYQMGSDMAQAVTSQLVQLYSGTLSSLSEMVTLIEDSITNMDPYPADMISSRNAIRIQTMHSSKGLEYPAVIIAGLNEGEMPSRAGDRGILRFDTLYGVRLTQMMIGDPFPKVYRDWRYALVHNLVDRDYDEERRLMYVSTSRAMQHIIMICHKPSHFISSLSDSKIDEVSVTPVSLVCEEEQKKTLRPELPEREMVRRKVGVHRILRHIPIEKGLGREYGIKIHADAERIAHGMAPWNDFPELDMVREVLSSLKGSRITTELPCILPISEYMIEGRMDIFAEFEDRVEIHDWKTDISKDNLEEYKLQLSVYAHAASSLGKPVKCWVHFLTLGNSVPFDPLPIEFIEARTKEMLGN